MAALPDFAGKSSRFSGRSNAQDHFHGRLLAGRKVPSQNFICRVAGRQWLNRFVACATTTTTVSASLWGLAIGASSLLATVAAFQVLDSARRLGRLLAVAAALAVAYVVYEAGLFVAASGLGGTDEFTAPMLGKVARLNALWVVGLGAACQARLMLGGARVKARG